MGELPGNLFFDQNPLPMWVYDLESYQFLAVNHAAVVHYGWSKEEFLAMTIKNIRPPEDVSRLVENVEHITEGLDEAGTWRHIKKDGSLIFVEIVSHTLEYKGRRAELVVSMDVTERKRTEKSLRESEERFRSYIENANDNIFTLDLTGRITSANRAMYEKLGYTEAELLGMSALELTEPERRAEVAQALQHIWAGESIDEVEVPVRTVDGKTFIVQIRGRAIVKDGKLVETLHIARDVTEQKFAEKALRESEARYRSIFEGVQDAILVTSFDGRVLAANQRACEIYGYTQTEWLTKYVADLIPEGQMRIGAHSPMITAPVETVNLRANGQSFPAEISGRIDTINGEEVLLVVVHDITERKRAQEKIDRHVAYLNALRDIDRAITSTFDLRVSLDTLISRIIPILAVDAAAVLLLSPVTNNLEFAAGAGFRMEAIRTSSVKLGESYAGRAALERRTVQIPDLALEPQDFFPRGFIKDENLAGYYGAPLIVKGKVIGVLEVFHRSVIERDAEWLDIFEILAGQAAIAIDNSQLFQNLQRSNTQLERRVAERTAELRQLNLELEHANRAKDEFLATMSHELRTPLNSILGLSETLLEQRRAPLNEHQQKSLEIIASSGRHLLELINDVLDLSKIEAGKLDYYPQVIEADALCESSLSFVRQQAMHKLIELSFGKDPAVSKLYADPRRLKQILVNLLTNAVKFTPENGTVKLQIISDSERDLIQFSVIDTGIGIAREDLKKLFQPFSQVDSSLTREFEGTGLGLALVQRLTDLHGGSVEVESEPGKGSRFTVNIPWRVDLIAQQEAVDGSGESPVSKSHTVKQASTRGRILLAEDNMANVLTIGEYLESHGFEVVTASDGVQAIEMAENTDPGLILMDIQMPALDGLEAIRRLREDPRFASTPIIALTALAMPGDRARCLAAGANEYMSKPVGLKILRQTIENLIHAPK